MHSVWRQAEDKEEDRYEEREEGEKGARACELEPQVGLTR